MTLNSSNDISNKALKGNKLCYCDCSWRLQQSVCRFVKHVDARERHPETACCGPRLKTTEQLKYDCICRNTSTVVVVHHKMQANKLLPTHIHPLTVLTWQLLIHLVAIESRYRIQLRKLGETKLNQLPQTANVTWNRIHYTADELHIKDSRLQIISFNIHIYIFL